jgi:RimJ/RimL family protein N-acetyltransferase
LVQSDLIELVTMQERGAVAGLSGVFPQETYPFPRDTIRSRWAEELVDPTIAAYVATMASEGDRRLVGFAARRDDQLLHFGTAVETWGSGLATWLHDELLATFPTQLRLLRLWVFADNHRARRFYEKLGWQATDSRRRTPFPPHPVLVEYEKRLPPPSR